MSLLSSASRASRWRGYEYFQQKKVPQLEQLGDMRFQSTVSGNYKSSYTTIIDIKHPRKSTCDCPHANGKRIICKHMVATFFTAFPEEAEKYYAEALAYEEESERYQEEQCDKLVNYVRSLSKEEAQDKLLEVLDIAPEWLWENFILNNID